MAMYHYIVGYDSDKDRWFVEDDPNAYLPDGNVFYPDRAESADWGWNGWHLPDEGTMDEHIDYKCHTMLGYLVPIWPSPVVNGEL
jgi:hypothetical protein